MRQPRYTVLLHVVLIVTSLAMVFPIVWVFLTSFKTSQDIIRATPIAPARAMDAGELRWPHEDGAVHPVLLQ